MSEAERLIRILRQTSNPIGSQLVRNVCAQLARLDHIDKVMSQIRDVTGLSSSSPAELPELIDDIISNLAAQNVALAAELELAHRRIGAAATRAAELEALFADATVFGTTEADLIAWTETESPWLCPRCGGSGHVDDGVGADR